MCTLSVSNVIYHKFSHGAAFYTLNGKNVNVMLEFANRFRSPVFHNRLWDYEIIQNRRQMDLTIQNLFVSIAAGVVPYSGRKTSFRT